MNSFFQQEPDSSSGLLQRHALLPHPASCRLHCRKRSGSRVESLGPLACLKQFYSHNPLLQILFQTHMSKLGGCVGANTKNLRTQHKCLGSLSISMAEEACEVLVAACVLNTIPAARTCFGCGPWDELLELLLGRTWSYAWRFVVPVPIC